MVGFGFEIINSSCAGLVVLDSNPTQPDRSLALVLRIYQKQPKA